MDTLLENPNLARNPSYRSGLGVRAVKLEPGKVSIMSREVRSARFSIFFRISELGRSPNDPYTNEYPDTTDLGDY